MTNLPPVFHVVGKQDDKPGSKLFELPTIRFHIVSGEHLIGDGIRPGDYATIIVGQRPGPKQIGYLKTTFFEMIGYLAFDGDRVRVYGSHCCDYVEIERVSVLQVGILRSIVRRMENFKPPHDLRRLYAPYLFNNELKPREP